MMWSPNVPNEEERLRINGGAEVDVGAWRRARAAEMHGFFGVRLAERFELRRLAGKKIFGFTVWVTMRSISELREGWVRHTSK